MWRKLTVAIAILGSLGCSHILLHTAKLEEPAASRAPSANETNFAKVAAYFNQGSPEAIERNDVEIVEGRLISRRAASKNVGGHFLEDCRKVALRQAILDATAAGYAVEGFSRSGSHRLELFTDDPIFKEDPIGAMVGVNIIHNGQASALTYTYDMDDNSNGSCRWIRTQGADPGMQKRKEVEKRMFEQDWPKLSNGRKKEIRSWGKFKGMSDQQIAAKSVGKLIEFECEQMSLNGAVKTAQEFFRARFHSQPIVHLDFLSSSVRSNIGDEGRRGKLEKLEGYWAFRMSDPLGNNTASAKVDFSLKDKGDACEGQVSSTAEPF